MADSLVGFRSEIQVVLLRHLLAILILPFTVAVLVPVRIAQRYAVTAAVGDSPGLVALQLLGFAMGAIGLALFASSLRRFATEGRGTLAPWDPPRAVWAAAFWLLNLIYIPLVEEPQLERRFGESYREYRRHVRRFVPRLRPWSG